MTTADDALGKVNELLYEYMETPKDDQEAKLQETVLGIFTALKEQDEFVLEIHLAEMGLNSLVHLNPDRKLDVGTAGANGEWQMSEVTMNHEIRWNVEVFAEGQQHITIFCHTCKTAAKERETGV